MTRRAYLSKTTTDDYENYIYLASAVKKGKRKKGADFLSERLFLFCRLREPRGKGRKKKKERCDRQYPHGLSHTYFPIPNSGKKKKKKEE